MTLIAAMDRHRGIGYRNALPWRLPADLHYFKEMTWGHAVLMGRRTFESIARPLPGRTNLVLSRELGADETGVFVVRSVEQALAEAQRLGQALFVIGGAEVFRQTLPLADRVLLTRIEEDFPADVRFPELPEDEWQLISCVPGATDAENPYAYAFLDYRRRKPASH